MSDDEEESVNNGGGSVNSMNIGIKNKLSSPGSDLTERQDGDGRNSDMALKIARGKVTTKNRKRELQGFDRRNFILHQRFIRRDFNACKALIKVIVFH